MANMRKHEQAIQQQQQQQQEQAGKENKRKGSRSSSGSSTPSSVSSGYPSPVRVVAGRPGSGAHTSPTPFLLPKSAAAAGTISAPGGLAVGGSPWGVKPLVAPIIPTAIMPIASATSQSRSVATQAVPSAAVAAGIGAASPAVVAALSLPAKISVPSSSTAAVSSVNPRAEGQSQSSIARFVTPSVPLSSMPSIRINPAQRAATSPPVPVLSATALSPLVPPTATLQRPMPILTVPVAPTSASAPMPILAAPVPSAVVAQTMRLIAPIPIVPPTALLPSVSSASSCAAISPNSANSAPVFPSPATSIASPVGSPPLQQQPAQAIAQSASPAVQNVPQVPQAAVAAAPIPLVWVQQVREAIVPTSALVLRNLPSAIALTSIGQLFLQYGRVQVKPVFTARFGLCVILQFGSIENALAAKRGVEGIKFELTTKRGDDPFGCAPEYFEFEIAFVALPMQPIQISPSQIRRIS
jgi:hypothetical protein